MYQHRPAHPGPLRRFLAALAARLRLTAADMPERSPLEAGHWESAPPAPSLPDAALPEVALPEVALPEVALPRHHTATRPATPAAAQPAATVSS